MEDEFSELDFHNYQNEFLEDWWSPKKLFIGSRQAGKTTLINSELRRFSKNHMNSLVISTSHHSSRMVSQRYIERFGENPKADFKTASEVRDGFHRGNTYDAVLIDEAQQMEINEIIRLVHETNVLFLRACACKSMGNHHDLMEEYGSDYFDSIYKV